MSLRAIFRAVFPPVPADDIAMMKQAALDRKRSVDERRKRLEETTLSCAIERVVEGKGQ